MNDTTLPAVPEQTIEYGGCTWTPGALGDMLMYKANSPLRDDLHIHQYGPDRFCAGRWNWQARYHMPDIQTDVLRLESSGVEPTRELAMAACINARDNFIDEMKQALRVLCPDEPYADGFRAGQEDIKARIAKVVA